MFIPNTLVSKELSENYNAPMPELFELVTKTYPELWSLEFRHESLMLIANELLPILEDPKYKEIATSAYNYFFE